MATKPRPTSTGTSFAATVPPRHKDVVPSAGTKVIDRPFTPPPGLSPEQQALVDECGDILDAQGRNVLQAKLLGGISDFFGMDDDTVRAIKGRAAKRGIAL